MINYCLKKWQQNKPKLENYIQNNEDNVKNFNYDDFLQLTVDTILNGKDTQSRRGSSNSGGIEWQTHGIKQLCNNGGNCSMNFYLIPRNSFDKSPTEADCLLTFAFKDSPRDTLKAIQDKYSRSDRIESQDFVQLCYELIERMVCPYNAGLV